MRLLLLAPLLLALSLPSNSSAQTAKKHKASKSLRTPAQTPGFGDPAHGGTPGNYPARPEVQAWIERLALETGMATVDIQDALVQARYQRRAAQLMMPAPKGVPKNWFAYRDRFVEPVRLQTGLRFWAEHADTLARAEAQYGVPAALIMGILGVETNYGQIMGNFRVLDALATLAFDFPGKRSDRSPFFQSELGAFLQLAKAEGRSPADFKGSFAGAMGYGQFMPSSWRQYAVDFDGDAHIDLIGNPADAIASVANFLRQHGWTPGMPTHIPAVAPPAAQRERLLERDIEPHWSLAALQQADQALPEPALERLAQHGPWAFVELENGPKVTESYVLGSKNFWVVTRYNRSAYYAMAVISLGERLEQLRSAGQ